jgi:ABC-type branched-subunit amino acid transport system ATPase component
MLLDVQGVHVGYGDVPVLHDVTFHLEMGEIITIVGPNGAGYTTLLRTLSGGEQQMLATARALMAWPTLLMLAEPSWGVCSHDGATPI